MIKETGLEQYTDQEEIIEVAKHNFEVASRIKEGEIQFNHAFVDLEGVCNLACHGCFKFIDRDKTRRKLSYKEITDAIDFAQERKARVIVIAGAGEPTLDSDFRRIIEYIHKNRLSPVVFTNGSTLNEDLSNFLFDNNVSLIVKKFAVDYEKQNYLIGRQGMSKKMQMGLETLIKVKKQREEEEKPISNIAIECYVSRENIPDIPHVLRYCRNNELVPYIEAFITTGQTTTTISKLIPSQQQLNDMFEQLAQIDREEYNIPTPLMLGTRVYGREPCMKGKAGFAVHTDGTVLECVSGRYLFGNIRNKSLKEIFDLNNPRTRDFYSSSQCLGCKCSDNYR